MGNTPDPHPPQAATPTLIPELHRFHQLASMPRMVAKPPPLASPTEGLQTHRHPGIPHTNDQPFPPSQPSASANRPALLSTSSQPHPTKPAHPNRCSSPAHAATAPIRGPFDPSPPHQDAQPMLQGQAPATQLPHPLTTDLHVRPISPHPRSRPWHNRQQAGRTLRPYHRRSVLQRTAPCLSHLRRQCIRSDKSSRACEAYPRINCAFLPFRQGSGRA